MKPDVTLVDTTARDGLGISCNAESTAEKIALINMLVNNGLKKIECAAFNHPRIKPGNADAERVINALERVPGVRFIGIAPNEIACRRALNTNVNEIGTLVAVSETFNQRVMGCSTKETLFKTFPAIFQACQENKISIRTYVLTAFGCLYEGEVQLRNIVDITSRLSYMGVEEVSLVDTFGMANPKQVRKTICTLQELDNNMNIAVHFHNTRGLALVNCLAAYEAGIHTFDTAIGGFSNTPFGVPKLGIGSWNVPTEDLVNLFEEIGVNTGIDLDSLLDSVRFVQKIAKRELPSNILKANTAFKLINLPEPLKAFRLT